MSDHFSEISSQIWNSLFWHNVLTSVMAYHEHCILVQQKLDILAAFTNSVLHQSVWSEFSDIQTTLPGHQCCGHFNSICMPMSQFSISVWCKGLLGYGGVAPMHIWLLEVAKLFCVFISFVPTWEIVWSDLHTSISPAYCSYIWLLPDLPCMEGVMFVLQVGVVYPCSLYHIWLASCCYSLCKSGCPVDLVCEL